MTALTVHAALAPDRAAQLARDVAPLATLEQVIHWGLSLTAPADIVEVVVQDEFCHDVVMTWQADYHLVFDTT